MIVASFSSSSPTVIVFVLVALIVMPHCVHALSRALTMACSSLADSATRVLDVLDVCGTRCLLSIRQEQSLCGGVFNSPTSLCHSECFSENSVHETVEEEW